MKTLQQLAQQALDIQDASNLSGVAHSFSDATRALHQYVRPGETVAQHPITLVMLDKLVSLANGENLDRGMTAAYQEVHRLAEGNAQAPVEARNG